MEQSGTGDIGETGLMAIENPAWIAYSNVAVSGYTITNTNAGINGCYAGAMGMGDALATTLNGFADLVDEDWEVTFQLSGRNPNGRAYLGLCSAEVAVGADVKNYVNWTHCLYISTETNTGAEPPHPAGTVYIYEKSATPKIWFDGIWQSSGAVVSIRCLGGVITYLVGDRILYRSITAPVYPLEAVVAMACHNMVVTAQIVSGPNVGVGSGQIAEGSSTGTGCAATWTFPAPSALPQPPTANAPIPIRFQETINQWQEYNQEFANKASVSNTKLKSPVRMFEVEWDGLSAEQAAMLDAHYDSTSGGIYFAMTNPHTDEELLFCRYASYSRTAHTRFWSQSRQATIIKYVTPEGAVEGENALLIQIARPPIG